MKRSISKVEPRLLKGIRSKARRIGGEIERSYSRTWSSLSDDEVNAT